MCRKLCVGKLRHTVEANYEAYCEAYHVGILCVGILKEQFSNEQS